MSPYQLEGDVWVFPGRVDPFLRGVCKSMHRYFCFLEDRNTWIRYLSNFIQIFKKRQRDIMVYYLLGLLLNVYGNVLSCSSQ